MQAQELLLSPLFADHMVLQQQSDVPLWGSAMPGSRVEVSASWGATQSAVADAAGHWKAVLATPAAGGPFEIRISTAQTNVYLRDVLLGEVWLASGQSNMEMPLNGFLPNEPIDNSAEEIQKADYSQIRMFTVQRHLATRPQSDPVGEWQLCQPETAPGFSATAYFFARHLHQELGVPIGIIHSSWGGTAVEAWVSALALEEFPAFSSALTAFDEEQAVNWLNQYERKARPYDKATLLALDLDDARIAAPAFDDSDWAKLSLPSSSCALERFVPDAQNTQLLNGAFWYRKKVNITDVGTDYVLRMGAIDDADVTYFNGQQIGATWNWQQERVYQIPRDLIQEGINTIAIKHFDGGGGCSIAGPITLNSSSGSRINLEGEWSALFYADLQPQSLVIYGLDAQQELPKRPVLAAGNPNDLPASLFNGMIHPLIPYKIKGAIWYQGESNVGRAQQYSRLFPRMIQDWRSRWKDDFSFYFVQIAPFGYGSTSAAALREAQRLSLRTPHTGMAVTLDIGDSLSIHPGNKQDVGKRLALLALANDYDADVVSTGPQYENHEIHGDIVIVNFRSGGSGLQLRSSEGFEIAGADRVFKKAEATVKNNQVWLSSSEVESPKYVRYAWKDYVEATLFNNAGLPASSFTSLDLGEAEE